MNNDFLAMVQQHMENPDFIKQLSRQIGEQDTKKTAAAASGIASILTGALAKNASSGEGAKSLAHALDRDHDGGMLDNLSDMLSGALQDNSDRTLNGSGILSHILGDRQSGAANMVSKLSGLDTGKISRLMVMLAPVVMGMLGKAKHQKGLDGSGLAGMLSGAFAQQKAKPNNPAMDMISGFIDSDNDGDISDDIARLGQDLLGGLFSRR